jgi:hypothetical protein
VADEITPGWFGRWFIRNYIEPSAKTRRGRAPKAIAPGAQVDPSVLDRFLRSNDTARELVLRARTCDVNRVRFRNPFVPLIHFTVGTGFVTGGSGGSLDLQGNAGVFFNGEFSGKGGSATSSTAGALGGRGGELAINDRAISDSGPVTVFGTFTTSGGAE